MMTHKTQKTLDTLAKYTPPFTLGSLILSIRQGEELSQVEFANLLGISKQYLCDIEHERRSISPKAAENFAKKLGYSPEQFMRLCLQDLLRKDGFAFSVELKAA